MNVGEMKQKTSFLLEKHGVRYAGLFGSRARGETHSASDFDILVGFSRPIGLFEFVELEQELSKSLRGAIDLVTEDALSPYIRESVFRDLRIFYGQR